LNEFPFIKPINLSISVHKIWVNLLNQSQYIEWTYIYDISLLLPNESAFIKRICYYKMKLLLSNESAFIKWISECQISFHLSNSINENKFQFFKSVEIVASFFSCHIGSIIVSCVAWAFQNVTLYWGVERCLIVGTEAEKWLIRVTRIFASYF
jgi:hypothetical protein